MLKTEILRKLNDKDKNLALNFAKTLRAKLDSNIDWVYAHWAIALTGMCDWSGVGANNINQGCITKVLLSRAPSMIADIWGFSGYGKSLRFAPVLGRAYNGGISGAVAPTFRFIEQKIWNKLVNG